MRKSLLLSTGLAAVLGTPAYAESWYLVSTGNTNLIFADADSVSRNGNYVQVGVLNSLLDSVPSTGSPAYYVRGPMNFECGANRYQNLGGGGYTSASTYVGEVQIDKSWQAVASGSPAAALYEFGCSSGFRTNPISDPFAYAEEYWYYYYYYDY